ncbi:putative copper resistance protein D [Geodermatophilus bullaregiensis]|uniref:CopD family protein n=1 Tax=Geodermatophilus bullaregiensis TaxID=1564160 RepID=UPI00195B6F4D|nr:CopD family protein [Geodermatophilus bullaregiensis]MBM7804251.1 putative copper resistance protein D [Geodermatophilus bullaregiensis]
MTAPARTPSPPAGTADGTALPRTGSPDRDLPASGLPDHDRPRRVPGGALVAAGLGLAAVLVLAVAVGGGARSGSGTPGLGSAGPFVEWGLPVTRLAGRIAGLGTVGTLLFAAVLRPGVRGVLPAASRRAARAASAWALAWAAATAAGAVLTVSELLGVGPLALPASAVGVFVTDVATGRAALVSAGVAVLVALLARRCTRAPAAGALLAAALVGLVVPVVLAGHSATADDHVPAVTTLGVHVVTAAVWVGGLAALLAYGRRRDDLVPAAARFSAVALACFVLTGASGLLAAWLVLGGDPGGLRAVPGTGYGRLLLAKTAALLALGVLGALHRRVTLRSLRAGRPGGFRRFAAVEVGVMLGTVALAVALSAAPPPPGGTPATGGPAAADAQPGPPGQPAPAAPDPMAGHDHGELSVTVLIDEERFHVSAPVAPGTRVTVHNAGTTEVTVTAADGSFDVVVPGRALLTFPAPERPGEYAFTSRHSAAFADVLVVR